MAKQPEEDPGFVALMKPILDLTRDWDNDLCLHLEEYLNYIRQYCGDELTEGINFSKAAHVVLNSASIYSKKVDFLFKTVLQLLDTLTKKQSEAKKNKGDQEEDGEAGTSANRKKKGPVIDLDDFAPVDDIAAERPSRLDLKKELQKLAERKKRPQIVLNAAIKARPKEKTSCCIYDHAGNVMGKKEEFRLNWRISSDGTLHEEFVINSNRFNSMEPVEVTVYENDNAPADNSHHDYDDNPSFNQRDIAEFSVMEAPLNSSVIVNGPIERESDLRALGEVRERREKQNLVDEGDIQLAWQPNDFNHNIPEKPIKKRNIIKLPPSLADEKKRKKSCEASTAIFTVTDVLFEQYKNSSYGRDPDFGYQSKEAFKRKQQLLLNHRKKYFDYVEKMLGAEDIDEFPGFYDEDDGDNDFDGFGSPCEENDDIGPEINLPLPGGVEIQGPANNEQGWNRDDTDTYDSEAKKTIQAFRTRKIDHGRITDLAKRVDEWHEKILPKLEAAEQRSSFDIHGYGTKVIEVFDGNIGTSKLFEEIVGGQSREEVTRYFLASLLLANQNNVELTKTDPSELSIDCMKVKLLSTVRHHEELDDNLRHTSDK